MNTGSALGEREANRFVSPQLDTEAPTCPDHLSAIAKQEWDRVTPILVDMGTITLADRSVLAAYCNAYSRWVEATIQMRQEGLTVITKSDNHIQNPLLGIANRAEEVMVKHAKELALTPYARSKLQIAPKKKVELTVLLDDTLAQYQRDRAEAQQ